MTKSKTPVISVMTTLLQSSLHVYYSCSFSLCTVYSLQLLSKLDKLGHTFDQVRAHAWDVCRGGDTRMGICDSFDDAGIFCLSAERKMFADMFLFIKTKRFLFGYCGYNWG